MFDFKKGDWVVWRIPGFPADDVVGQVVGLMYKEINYEVSFITLDNGNGYYAEYATKVTKEEAVLARLSI